MIKLGIIKVTADGEQCNIEMDVDQKDVPPGVDKDGNGLGFYDCLRAYVEPYFKLMDDRLFEMNKQVLASNELVKQMTPEAQHAMHHALEHLMGQAPKSSIDKLVKDGQDRREREKQQASLDQKGAKKPTSH